MYIISHPLTPINLVVTKLQYNHQMFRMAFRFQPLSVIKLDKPQYWGTKLTKYIMMPAVLTSSLYYFKMKDIPSMVDDGKEYELPKEIYRNKLFKFIAYLYRFLELSLIFIPSILLLPLCLFKSTKQYWLNVFLWGIKKAGFVWIKVFQYLSHRRDIIGKDMADKFMVLRQNSPKHSVQSTKETIKRMYNKQIKEMFEQFDLIPIASGSVSQVYKAKLNGNIVAVKVRHPNVAENIDKDIDLMFAISSFLSCFSKQFEIPITHHSLKKVLAQQLYFSQQKRNIDKFNKIIVDKNITFPKTYPQSNDQVLIEEYIDGKTIGYYEVHAHNMNRLIANIGAKAFFSMLMKYNFVHADCHAGNILVKIKQSPNELTNNLYSISNSITNYLLAKIIKFGFQSQFLRKLSEQNYLYEKQVQDLIKLYKKRVQIVLIDVGMAIRLTEQKKESFQSFLQQIIKGDAKECAKWIYRISKFNGKQLIEGQNNKYFCDLQTMFSRVHKTSLDSLQGIVVLTEMLGVIRSHNMKIDGQISILLTNMLILQAIAKDLDPKINILRCAVPYLQYK